MSHKRNLIEILLDCFRSISCFKQKVSSILEQPSFIPSVIIRPHHWDDYHVRYALARRWPVDKIMGLVTGV